MIFHRWGLFLIILGLAAPQATRADAPPRHLRDALDLVQNLEPANNSYTHARPDVSFTAPYRSHADCSGFLGELLKHSFDCTPAQFQAWFRRRKPTASVYHDAIVKQVAFEQISDFRHVRPGDILAVKYAPPKPGGTGHVMLVSGPPRPMKARDPIVPETQQWEVPIIDSSGSGHGRTDTRHGKGPDGKDHDGLGAGTFRVYTGHDGQVVGYTRSITSKTLSKAPERDLVIGRFQPERTAAAAVAP